MKPQSVCTVPQCRGRCGAKYVGDDALARELDRELAADPATAARLQSALAEIEARLSRIEQRRLHD